MSDRFSRVLPFSPTPLCLSPTFRFQCAAFPFLSVAAVVCGDDTVLLTPGRMSQRQVKERDKEREREKEAGLQTPNREHASTPSALSPGVSYSHGKSSTAFGTLLHIAPQSIPLHCRLCACILTVLQTSQCPLRNYWQLWVSPGELKHKYTTGSTGHSA